MRRLPYAVLILLCSHLLAAQDIQISRENKTIAITAEESVTADAEVALLEIGYQNYGSTKDLTYQDNVRAANHVLDALLAAGVPKDNIETNDLRLGRVEPEQNWSPELKKERQFSAKQSWKVTTSVDAAQRLVDVAIQAGANDIEALDWNVSDPMKLQAQAGRAALAKARTIAEQMATGLGVKIGPLVYASNRAPVPKLWRGLQMNAQTSTLSAVVEKPPKLKLFPEKVKSEATVYAIFAIE